MVLKMSVGSDLKPELETKVFHATMLVTRAEEWWVEARSLEEAETLLAAGRGHRSAVGKSSTLRSMKWWPKIKY
jgi:hypothetical protein